MNLGKFAAISGISIIIGVTAVVVTIFLCHICWWYVKDAEDENIEIEEEMEMELGGRKSYLNPSNAEDTDDEADRQIIQ